MHENAKGIAGVDILAAGINGQAAEIVALAEEQARSARTRRDLAGAQEMLHGAEHAASPERLAKYEHEEQLAQRIGVEAERLRDGAAELQRLTRQMRGLTPAGRS